MNLFVHLIGGIAAVVIAYFVGLVYLPRWFSREMRGAHRLELEVSRRSDPQKMAVGFALFVAVAVVALWIRLPQSLPNPPENVRLAAFERDIGSPGSERGDPVLIIGGDGYEFTYVTAKSPLELEAHTAGAKEVFQLDFTTATTSGDVEKADVLVLVGSLRLTIGDIDGHDALWANITSRGRRVDAHFKYANSARGPPVRKKIVIAGDLDTVDLGGARGAATRDMRILDLDVSEEERAEHEARLAEIRRDRGATERSISEHRSLPRPRRWSIARAAAAAAMKER